MSHFLERSMKLTYAVAHSRLVCWSTALETYGMRHFDEDVRSQVRREVFRYGHPNFLVDFSKIVKGRG